MGARMTGHPQYRRDIDGLRAIAVIAVVLYHFGMPGLGGGFVGVDVFFVISGFLIGGNLWREIDRTGRLQLGTFYMRRIRRLAPAYVVMVLVTFAVGWLVLLPFEYRELGKSMISATIYLSNVLFYRQAGYFDAASEEKPLLHTWSLSVEEQFYLVLPLTLLLLMRWRLVWVLVLIWAGSLMANLWFTPRDHMAAFYLFPLRAWEMLSGVLLAIWMAQRPAWLAPRWTGELGVLLIFGSIFLITAGDGFPGWWVIFPVLGSVMVIAAGTRDSFAKKTLSMREPVFVGLISYSLYLWHWPVLTLATYSRGGFVSLAEGAAWLGLAIALSILSWRFVEQPTRRVGTVSARQILLGMLAGSAAIIGLGGLVFKGDGMQGRFGDDVAVHVHASADFLQDWSRCQVAINGPLTGLEICAIGPENKTPQVLIWGDSHVRAMREGLAKAAQDTQVAGMIIWRAGCPPVFDLTKDENTATATQDAACYTANQQVRTALHQLDEIELVFLVGRWAYYEQGRGVGRDSGNHVEVRLTNAATFSEALMKTMKEISDTNKTVTVLRQMPEIAEYDARYVARALAHGRLNDTAILSVSRDSATLRAGQVDRQLRTSGVDLIDGWNVPCDDTTCTAIDGEIGYYFDNNHITNSAAILMAPLFAHVFEGARDD